MPASLTILRRRRQRRNDQHSRSRQGNLRTVAGFGFLASLILVLAVISSAFVYASLTSGLPSLDKLELLLDPESGQLLQPTRLYDRTGQHLVAVLAPQDSTRTYIPYDQFPKALIDATLALTEPGFMQSPGYSLKSWEDPSGHPTLAQQLVFDLLLWDQPATRRRAIHERMLAAQVTARFGRQKVLEWYLNSANFGNHAYGVEAAARLYFGKPASQLDLGESALLAAVSQTPTLNPMEAGSQAEGRRVQTLMVMQAMGFITPEQALKAMSAAPLLAPSGPAGGSPDLAPAFTGLVLEQLDAVFGPGRVERGGLVVRTSLDVDLQMEAACTVLSELSLLAGGNPSIPAADGSECLAASLLPRLPLIETRRDVSASAVLLDPQSGQVLAVAGDVGSLEDGSHLRTGPAGSSITPFLYLTGFTRGLSPATLLWDLPAGGETDLQSFHGPVRLRTALVNDYLAPARSVLGQMGSESVRVVAASFGLDFPSGLLENDFPISPLALAGALGTLANDGTQTGQSLNSPVFEPSLVLEVHGVDGVPWLDWSQPSSQSLLSPQLAYLVNHVLSDEAARWPSMGHPNLLEIGQPAAAKVSPSLDGTSAWAYGYTPNFVAVVHTSAGRENRADPQPAAAIWQAVLKYSVRGLPAEGWDMPPGVASGYVCDPSGLLPTAACPNVVKEVFLEAQKPVSLDNFFQSFPINRETGLLATVFTPPEMVEQRITMVLPAVALPWAEANGIQPPPSSYDTLGVPPSLEYAQITSPLMFSYQKGLLEVLGTAAGENFVSYRLEYGQGLYPREWLLVGTDVDAPVNAGLLGEWDTTGLDGLYALRLMVVRKDQRVEQALVQVTLDNTPPKLAITYPRDGQRVSLAEEPQLPLQAQVDDPFLAGVEFNMDGVLIGQADLAPYGILWIAQSGEHRLQVIATDQAGNRSEAVIRFIVE